MHHINLDGKFDIFKKLLVNVLNILCERLIF